MCLKCQGLNDIAERNSPVSVLKVSGVKQHSREKHPSGCIKKCQGLKYLAERNSPVSVLIVSGVKACSREKQSCEWCAFITVSGVKACSREKQSCECGVLL